MVDQIFVDLKKENDAHARQLRELSAKCGVAEPVLFFEQGSLPPEYINARGLLRDIYTGKVCAYSQAVRQVSAREERHFGKMLGFIIPSLKSYADISVFFDLLSVFRPELCRELIDKFRTDHARLLWQYGQTLDLEEKKETFNPSPCNREIVSFLRMYLMRRLDKWDSCRVPKTEPVKQMISKRLAEFSPWVQSDFGWQYILLKRLPKERRLHLDAEYAQGLSDVAKKIEAFSGQKFKAEQWAMSNLYNYFVFSQADFQVYIDLLMALPVKLQDAIVESFHSDVGTRFKTQCSIAELDKDFQQTEWEPANKARMKYYLTLARFELDECSEYVPGVVH